MMNEAMEKCVLQNIPWTNLPSNLKQSVGNSLKEYKKCISVYSIKNQVRFKGNLVKSVVRNEQSYYEELMTYSRENLMLYPYHLSDVIVKGLRITPFQFYTLLIIHVMESDKSYDSIPNFTAVDCLRILGIGRNEYIELMNQCRTKNKLFRKKHEIRPMLPSQPITINVDPWWIVDVGCLYEDDIKTINEDEKKFIDYIIDNGKQIAGSLDYNILHSLYKKGLVYYDVPIYDDDHIIVSTLGGFVMNRVLGDNFENLLYKIFVSIDEHTSVRELATILEIDLESVKNAVSLFCRLKIAQKKNVKTFSSHSSWSSSKKIETAALDLVPDSSTLSVLLPTEIPELHESSPDKSNSEKRMAFLFDSTLTAFLMMGNLSPSLKDHAVTLFEAGKLTDEALNAFLDELDKVAEGYSAGSCVFGSETPSAGESEGEARRYFEHALTLRSTVKALRSDNCPGKLDLIRWESLKSLSADTCVRFLKKNYNLLMSMAPLNKETPLLSSPKLPHIGPPIPEVNSVWFKLYLYHKTCCGPSSLLLVRGVRLWNVPKIFRHCSKIMVTTWGHDPHFIPIENLLTIINDTLKESPVLLQACNPKTCVLPFPKIDNLQNEFSFLYENISVKSLSSILNLKNTCGYVTCVTTPTKYEKKHKSEQPTIDDPSPVFQENGVSLLKEELEKLNDKSNLKKTLLLEPVYDTSEWTLLDCCFGLPLFNSDINQNICKYIVDNQMWKNENVTKLIESNELLSKDLLDFIELYKDSDKGLEELLPFDKSSIAWPVDCLIFEDGKLKKWK